MNIKEKFEEIERNCSNIQLCNHCEAKKQGIIEGALLQINEELIELDYIKRNTKDKVVINYITLMIDELSQTKSSLEKK